MRAYTIAMGLILFNLCIPLAGAFGFTGPIRGEEIQGIPNTGFNPLSLIDINVLTSISALGLGLASRLLGLDLRISMGAIIFAVVFAFTSLPLNSVLNQLTTAEIITAEISSIIKVACSFVFIFAFAQMTGLGGKVAY